MFSSLMLENKKTNVQVVFQAKVKHAYSVKKQHAASDGL